MTDHEGLESLRADILSGRIESAANRLAATADRLRRIAGDVRGQAGKKSPLAFPYGFHASEAIGEVINTLPNINLGGLASAASEADASRIAGE